MKFEKAFNLVSEGAGPRILKALFFAKRNGSVWVAAAVLDPDPRVREMGFSAYGDPEGEVPGPVGILLEGAALSPVVRGEERSIRAGELVAGTLLKAIESVPEGIYEVSPEEANLGIYFSRRGGGFTAWLLFRDPETWDALRGGIVVDRPELKNILSRFVSP